MDTTYHISEIVDFLRSRVSVVPEVGVICGSGLGSLVDIVTNQTCLSYRDIPHFPQSTVAGHAGELVFGTIGAVPVVCMKGRFHPYEGYHPAKVAVPIRVMAALGVKLLIVTNAAGGVNKAFNVGDLMIIKDHLYLPGLAGNNPLVGRNDERFGPRFPATNGIYDEAVRDLVKVQARHLNLDNVLHEGVYTCVSGPSYETPHEIEMIRVIGGDAVGMSTVPEVIVAAHCGLRVLGMSLITNRCVGPNDNLPAPTHEEVLEAVTHRQPDIQALIENVIRAVDVSSMAVSAAKRHFDASSAVKIGVTDKTSAAEDSEQPVKAVSATSFSVSSAINHVFDTRGIGWSIVGATAAIAFLTILRSKE